MTFASFQAMGTTVEAWGAVSEERLSRWFVACEDRFSRFRRESELSRINALGAGRHSLSPEMRDVMVAADLVLGLTEGLVDIGVGAAVRAWGYRDSFEQTVDLDAEPSPPMRGAWRLEGEFLELGEGVVLDLGGVAKGWTCDQAVAKGLASVVSAGGDIRSSDRGTVASIVDPWGDRVATIPLGKGALATSSVVKRSWRVGSRRVSHVVDPRSMSPVVSPVVSASVVASSAVLAEAGAKAVLIRGADGLEWADRQGWIQAALAVWRDGTVYGTTGAEWAA